MTRTYLEVITDIRMAINGSVRETDNLVEVIQATDAAELRAREEQDDYLARKFHGLSAELDYLMQLTCRSQEQHLGDRYDIIVAECAMIENYLTNTHGAGRNSKA